MALRDLDEPRAAAHTDVAVEAVLTLDAFAAGGAAAGDLLELASVVRDGFLDELVTPLTRARLAVATARGHRLRGEQAQARDALAAADRYAAEQHDTVLMADIDLMRAQLAFDRGELDLSESFYAQAARVYRDERITYGLSVAELGVVDTLLERASVASARVILESLLSRETDPGLRVRALLNVVVCSLEDGAHASVHRAVEEVLADGSRAAPRARALAHYYEAIAFYLEGRDPDAATSFDRAMRGAVALGHQRFAAHIRGYAALSLAGDVSRDTLVSELHATATALRACGDRRYESLFLGYAARAASTEVVVDPDDRSPIGAALRCLAGAPTGAAVAPLEVRLARRFAAVVVPASESSVAPSVPARAHIRIAADGSYLERRGSERVELRRRESLKGVLAALTHHLRRGGGDPISTDAIFSAGWPAENIRVEAAAARVYTAIRTLRKMGLGATLQTVGRGYRLDPDSATLVVVDPASGRAL